MEKTEITRMSSKGQIVIPQKLRNRMKLREGEKFVVLGSKETILLRKLEMPSFKNFDKLLKKTPLYFFNYSSIALRNSSITKVQQSIRHHQ